MTKDKEVRYPNEYNTQDNESQNIKEKYRYHGVLDEAYLNRKKNKKDVNNEDEFLGNEFIYW